jgi:hypothetical protein
MGREVKYEKDLSNFIGIPRKTLIKIRKLYMRKYFKNFTPVKQGGANDEIFDTILK